MNTFIPVREKITIKETDPSLVEALAKDAHILPVVATILAGRGLSTPEQCRRFFQPDSADFHDPFLFEHMERAVNRIAAAVGNNELIYIHGDYDVDGITATVILLKVLRQLGARCDYYLPNRLTEGYGVSREGIEEIHRAGCRLIITADCGITAHEEVAFAKSLGIDVIITDHHESHRHAPDAYAIIDPKLEGCSYPDRNLAGVGVALKVCHALAIRHNRDAALWSSYMDLAALGTAADIVPLTGENRIIAKLGFEQIGQTRNTGLKKLVRFQQLEGRKISTADVVFMLAPCINAAGRLGDSHRGVKLLLCEDEAQASLYAGELVEMNKERRSLDKHVQDNAIRWVLDNLDFENEFVIVAGGEDWHAGVIGIAASKLVEKFYRPTFLFSIGTDGFARGSGRSIRSLHLLEALHDCSDILESYGGHEAAAGASLRVENLSLFRKRFNEAVRARITRDALVPQIIADAEVTLAQLTPKFFTTLQQMEPFGPGNMRPVFFCRGVSHRYAPRIVGNNHLKMTVCSSGQVMDAIAFNFGDRFSQVNAAKVFSLAFSLDENTFNGRTALQIKVKGVQV